jgi:hypothetical protein
LFLGGIVIGRLLPAGPYVRGGQPGPTGDPSQKVMPPGSEYMFAKLQDQTLQKVAPGDSTGQKVSPSLEDETSQKVAPEDMASQKVLPQDTYGSSPGGPGDTRMTTPGPPNVPDADEFGCAKLGDNAAQKVVPQDAFGAPADTGGSTGMSAPGPPDLPDADEFDSVK